ncbi:MAG: helix-hairpin-helix domain-containing protein [Pirellulales bacterium]|jgi:competence ComEA-like helix-hairpin-helix protein
MKPSSGTTPSSLAQARQTYETLPSIQQQHALMTLTVIGLATLAIWLTFSRQRLVDFFHPPERTIRFNLDINTAPQTELSLLPGIGPTMASRIIEIRQQRGPFKSVDDLIHVPGIGKITLQEMRPFIRTITDHHTEK